MTCIQLDGLIAAYCNAELDPQQWEAFYLHLAQCRDCTLHVQSYRKVVKLLKEERKTR